MEMFKKEISGRFVSYHRPRGLPLSLGVKFTHYKLAKDEPFSIREYNQVVHQVTGVTSCVVINLINGLVVGSGLARCSLEDTFNKAFARETSMKRAIRDWNERDRGDVTSDIQTYPVNRIDSVEFFNLETTTPIDKKHFVAFNRRKAMKEQIKKLSLATTA